MQIIEVYNPDAKLLVDYMARLERARNVMIRRKLLNWTVRKRPHVAAILIRKIDEAFKANARNYAKSAP